MLHIKASTCEWMRRASLILTIFTFIFFWASFGDFLSAKSDIRWKDISGAGTALWIFVILGAIIILLQLIPAIIYFFSFIGTGVHTFYTVDKKTEDEIPCCAERIDSEEYETK